MVCWNLTALLLPKCTIDIMRMRAGNDVIRFTYLDIDEEILDTVSKARCLISVPLVSASVAILCVDSVSASGERDLFTATIFFNTESPFPFML